MPVGTYEDVVRGVQELEQWLREEPLRSDPRPWIAALVECLQRMEIDADRLYVGDGELARLVTKYRELLPEPPPVQKMTPQESAARAREARWGKKPEPA